MNSYNSTEFFFYHMKLLSRKITRQLTKPASSNVSGTNLRFNNAQKVKSTSLISRNTGKQYHVRFADQVIDTSRSIYAISYAYSSILEWCAIDSYITIKPLPLENDRSKGDLGLFTLIFSINLQAEGSPNSQRS